MEKAMDQTATQKWVSIVVRDLTKRKLLLPTMRTVDFDTGEKEPVDPNFIIKIQRDLCAPSRRP